MTRLSRVRSTARRLPAAPGRTAAVVALTALAAGCGAGGDGTATADGPQFRGAVLGTPLERPDVTLTDTAGEPYAFGEETAGRVTLVMPIFTHCDDECPTQMADVAAGLDRLPADVRDDVDVVAVTTDPERDTPEVLRAWLDRFDPSFEGLTGTPEELSAAYRGLGLPDAEPETPGPDGGYQVRHVVQVFAFGRDDVARLGYPLGVTPGDYVHDLRLLADGVTPPEVSADEREQAARLTGGTAAVAGVTVFGAFLDPASGDLRLSLATGGSTPDRLVGAALADGTPVRLVAADGTPLPLDAASGPEVAPSEVLLLAPQAASRLAVDPDALPDDGDDGVRLVLQLAEAGELVVDVPAQPTG